MRWLGYLLCALVMSAFIVEAKPKKPNPGSVYHLRLYTPELVYDAEIAFDYDKATLRPTSFASLDALAKLLIADPSLSFTINAHCEQLRDAEVYSSKITDKRSKAVRDYLVQKGGVSAQNLETKGYEDSCPVDTNKTAEGRAKNRRIDVVIKSEEVSGCVPPYQKEPASQPAK